jgi:hypothetical protein
MQQLSNRLGASTVVRIMLVSLFISVSVGMLVAGTVVVISEPMEQSARLISSLRGLFDLFAIAVIASIGLSVPMGLAGGLLAVWMIRRQKTGVSLLMWLLRGASAGLVMGFFGSALVGVVTSQAANIDLISTYALLLSSYAGAAGALAGTLIATYCWTHGQKSV